jgi:hypothetical protein
MGMEAIRARDARRGTAERERTRQAERRETRQDREDVRREARQERERAQAESRDVRAESRLNALRSRFVGRTRRPLTEVQELDEPGLLSGLDVLSQIDREKAIEKEFKLEIGKVRGKIETKRGRKQQSRTDRSLRWEDKGIPREPDETEEAHVLRAPRDFRAMKKSEKVADRKDADRRTKASELRRRIQTLDDLGIPRPASLDIDSVNKSISGFKGSERELKGVERKERAWKALDDRIAKHQVREKEFDPTKDKKGKPLGWIFTGGTEWTASPGATQEMRRQFDKQRPGANIPIDLWTAEENDDFEFQSVKKFPELQDPSYITRLGELIALGGESGKVEARDQAEIDRANAIADFQLNFIKAPGGKAVRGATSPSSPAAAPRKRLQRPQGPIGQRSNTDVLNTVLGR